MFWLLFIFRKSKAFETELQYDNKYPQCKAKFSHDFLSCSTFFFIKKKLTEITKYVAKNKERTLKLLRQI